MPGVITYHVALTLGALVARVANEFVSIAYFVVGTQPVRATSFGLLVLAIRIGRATYCASQTLRTELCRRTTVALALEVVLAVIIVSFLAIHTNL